MINCYPKDTWLGTYARKASSQPLFCSRDSRWSTNPNCYLPCCIPIYILTVMQSLGMNLFNDDSVAWQDAQKLRRSSFQVLEYYAISHASLSICAPIFYLLKPTVRWQFHLAIHVTALTLFEAFRRYSCDCFTNLRSEQRWGAQAFIDCFNLEKAVSQWLWTVA